jgi:hypothetical protein
MPFDNAPTRVPWDDDGDRWLMRWLGQHLTLRDMVRLIVAIERSRQNGEPPPDPWLGWPR